MPRAGRENAPEEETGPSPGGGPHDCPRGEPNMSHSAQPEADARVPRISRRTFTTTAATAGMAAAVGLAPAVARAATEPELRAGAGEVSITPPEVSELFLVGPNKMATGVNDPLFARTLVLEYGSTRVAIVTTDLLVVHMRYNDELVAAVSRATGIPAEHVVINTQHTHSAPIPRLVAAAQERPESWRDTEYSKWLPEQIAASAKAAVDDLQPAQLRAGRETTQIGMNRRYMTRTHVTMTPNPHGAIVPWVDTLGAYAKSDGKRIAVLFSYAAHPVIIHGTSTLVSGDFPGLAIKRLRHRFSGGTGELDGVFMFAQGCGGNINGHPLRGGIDACSVVGGELAWAVSRTQLADLPSGPVRVASTELELPFQDPPSVAECQKWVDKFPESLPHREVLEIAKRGRVGTLRYPIRAISMGDELCILTLAHEPFCEYQLFAVEKSPFKHTLVFGYVHGVEQYIATRSAYELGLRGGYEASPHGHALQSKHRLALRPEVEEMIHESTVGVMKQLTG
ncbi:MAG: hypothetical protein DWQ31_10560 [Planctomycetota bacterium]|nr:MAG: hypothetical protein DWQ31_10560 [Planctomycetota bacterium]REJ88319.1 MAG: hypothetical protein DWQ35_20310 [Planctomycetota bacterium]